MKIVVCGSMSASREMVAIEKELLELGHEPILPSSTHEYAGMDNIDKKLTESAREKVEHDLIKGYFKKIENGDAVLIANFAKNNVEGYIGGNSFLEMGFAYVLNKPIYLINKIPELSYADEIRAMEPIVLNGDLSKIS